MSVQEKTSVLSRMTFVRGIVALEEGYLMDPNGAVKFGRRELVHLLGSPFCLAMLSAGHLSPPPNHYLPWRTAYSETVVLWICVRYVPAAVTYSYSVGHLEIEPLL